jgi:hypothetical protein
MDGVGAMLADAVFHRSIIGTKCCIAADVSLGPLPQPSPISRLGGDGALSLGYQKGQRESGVHIADYMHMSDGRNCAGL